MRDTGFAGEADSFAGSTTDGTGSQRTTALIMFGVLLASYAINAMDRQIFPLLAADVRKEYGFALSHTGLLSTVFTLGMAVAGVPTGYLLARFSRKAVGQIGIAIFSVGTALTAFSVGFADMLAYRAVTGIGEAMQLTALLAIASSYFTRYRAAAVGSVNFCFGIGAIVGPMLGGVLLAQYGTWRAPMIVFGLLGFVAMALIAFGVKPWLTETQARVQGSANSRGAPTLLNRNTVLLTFMSMIGGLIIYGYLGMYPTYLREQLGYTPGATSSVMGIFGLGVLASIGGGWLGDRFSPRLVFGATFLVAALLGYLLFHAGSAFVIQATLSFVWGLVVSGTIYVNLAGYHVKAVVGSLGSRASGTFVTSIYSAGAIAGYLIGMLASLVGWAQAGLIQITALSLLGVVLALALDPARMAQGVVKAG